MTRVPVYVSGQLKRRVIEKAHSQNRSVTCEVVVFLIRKFMPECTSLAHDVLRRSAPRNAPATFLDDGALEVIIVSLPDPLRMTVHAAAKRNFRSISAEIVKALTEEYLE